MSKTMQNIRSIKASDIPKIVERHYKAKEPVIFFGPPGIGKSAQVIATAKKLAEKEGLKFVSQPHIKDWENPEVFGFSTTLTSQFDELDTKGGLWIQQREGKAPIATFTSTEEFPEVGHGIKFLDEFTNGQPHIMNALQPILLEGTAGNKSISKDICFILASNRPTDNTGTNMVPQALRSRMATYDVQNMELDEWLDTMRAVGEPIDKRIEAFLKSFERYYYNFDPNKTSTYAYACPRTHHKTSRMIDGIDNINEASEIYAGWAGQDVGDAFRSFLKLAATVDIDNLMKNPGKISEHEDDIGKLYSICITLVDRAVKSKDAAQKVFDIMAEMSRDEFGLYIFNSLMKDMGKNQLLKVVAAEQRNSKLMARYSKLFN